MNQRSGPSGLRGILSSALPAMFFIAYPMIAYGALRFLSPRQAATVLLVALIPIIAPRLRRMKTGALRSLAILPLLGALVLVTSIALDSAGLVLLVPVVASLGFLVAFGTTLLGGTPMIERFARLSDPDLTGDEVRWCRLWTWIWCGYFALNASIAGMLALSGKLGWWTTYTGLLSYLLMGSLFGIEYPLRKFRFGRLRDNWLDQMLNRLFVAVRGSR